MTEDTGHNISTIDHSQSTAIVPKISEEAKSIEPNSLILNDLLTDKETPWKIHNCKIIDKLVTQDKPLPFIYHYDTLTDELKQSHPLTGKLLKQFQSPMSAEQAAQLLGVDSELIQTPWLVKITGTLVMFCEPLQIALRLKFTNTAKEYDPVYTTTPEKAVETSLQNWHFYGEIFLLNKGSKPLVMFADQDWIPIPQLAEYQLLPKEFGLTALSLLEENKTSITGIEEAIHLRLI